MQRSLEPFDSQPKRPVQVYSSNADYIYKSRKHHLAVSIMLDMAVSIASSSS